MSSIDHSRLARLSQSRPLAIIAAAAIVVACTAPSAGAQVGPNEASCRASLAKAGAKYMKIVQKIIAGCHKARNAGKIPPGTDCNDLAAADYKGKLPAAALTAQSAMTADSNCLASNPQVLASFGRCPAPVETVDDGGATSGIDNFVELADCLIAQTNSLAESTAAEVLGTPELPLSSDEQACHSALTKGVTKLVNTTIKEESKCQSASDRLGGPYDFSCVGADPKGKIAKKRTVAADAITSACTTVYPLSRGPRAPGAPKFRSCAETVSGVIICALDGGAKRLGQGTAAMLYELPGVCPGQGSYIVVPVATGTEVDTGFTGNVHDMDPILGYRAAEFTISCDVDCKNCVSTSVTPNPEACRCVGDASLICTADAECAGAGGFCQCQYGPPTPYNAAGTPACVTMPLDGPLNGSLDPMTGAVSLAVPLRVKIYLGITQSQPCPQCVSGTCSGGLRNGLLCTVDASDATFGDVSYDCPPSAAMNITGAGLPTELEYTTGSLSLPFGTPCDPPVAGLACACAACSLDGSQACNSNGDCAALGLGTCTSNGGGALRFPNGCSDLVCSPDPSGAANEGVCLAGPTSTYCDGFLRSNGDGILPCNNNTDCTFYGSCPGGSCGSCTQEKVRECFLDPIVATGEPGKTIVGSGCLGRTSSPAVNSAVGWPGPYRVKQNLAAELLCADGVTPYNRPGGSNCP